MPDTKAKKLSVSSADDPLVEADLEDDAASSGVKAVASAGLWRRSLLLPCLVVTSVVLLVLLLAGFGAVAYLMATGSGGVGRRLSSSAFVSAIGDARFEPLYINLVVDVPAIAACAKTLKASKLPCLNSTMMIVDEQAIGPLKCVDDAHQESSKVPDNCEGNAFALTASRSGIVIPETGVYMVHSTVQFADSIPYYVSSSIRVDTADCVADPNCWTSPKQRDFRAHIWLSCAEHNSARDAEVGNRFSTCTIDGVRRFNRGDLVSVTVTQAYREINPFHKATHMFILKI